MTKSLSNTDHYLQYLNEAKADVDLSRIRALCDRTQWDEPESPLDFNNLSVLALVMAVASEDIEIEKHLYLEMALDALTNNAKTHPLCAAHLALVQLLIGDNSEAIELAFSTLMSCSQMPPNLSSDIGLGLVYVPAPPADHIAGQTELLEYLHSCQSGTEQAIALCAEVLRRSPMVFYNSSGLRFLQLAAQTVPSSVFLHLALGISSIFNKRWEGVSALHRALQLNQNYAPTYQALFLTCKALGNEELADQWLTAAKEKAQNNPNNQSWQWTTLPSNSEFSYVPFGTLMMAVEAKVRSIVTSVLLVEGDWFEAEMEFWRKQLQPGMTVIDVGANAGVYTFSAAEQVGPTGRVLAVEPFAGCVQCLEETKRINNLDWVTVCAGAASDQSGTASLAVQGSSELNEIVTDGAAKNQDNIQTVECFTLDDLAEKYDLERVDWLKIDAEGHEMQVLKGSQKIIEKFAPGILYENIAGSKSTNNVKVAQFLMEKKYQLFRYQSFLQQFIPLKTVHNLQGCLNIIAIPSENDLLQYLDITDIEPREPKVAPPTASNINPLHSFHSLHYLRHNSRRLEHLSSLNISVGGMTVLEVGAGIGDHSHYYRDRKCQLTITEARPENIEYLKKIYPDADIRFLDMEKPELSQDNTFDVVHCYGLLYHLSNPEQALKFLSDHCSNLLFLETCVSFGEDESINLVREPQKNPTQAYSGVGCRPTRVWLFKTLQRFFPYVYVPYTQPNHEEFPIDWADPTKHNNALSRSVFVASRTQIENTNLCASLLMQQTRHS